MKPDRVVIVMNASAGQVAGGDADQLRQTLTQAFARHAISAAVEVVPGRRLRTTARQLAKRVTDGDLDAIAVAGGDGTISSVAHALAGSGVPLGVIPLGTLNHFAIDLGLPPDADDAIAVIAAGEVRDVDVGEVNGRTFINNSSIGLYPYLVLVRERRRRRTGVPKGLGTILGAWRALRDMPIRRLSIRAAGGAQVYRSPLVFIGNNPYRLSGASMGKRDSLDGGKLCLYVARQRSRAALLWLAVRAFVGRVDYTRALTAVAVEDIEISSHRRRMLVSLDGEIEILRLPLRYRIRPAALRVFAPPAAAATAPGACVPVPAGAPLLGDA
jgi:diacylglycerol kinase family enzyme